MFDRRKSESRRFTEIRGLSPPRTSGIQLLSTKSKQSSPQYQSKIKRNFCFDECSVFPMFTSSSEIKSILKLEKLREQDLKRLQFQLADSNSKLPKLGTLPKVNTIFYPFITKHKQTRKQGGGGGALAFGNITRHLSQNIAECEYRTYLKQGLLELQGMHLEYCKELPTPMKKRNVSISTEEKRRKLMMYEGKRRVAPLERKPTPKKSSVSVFEFTLFTSCILSINRIRSVKQGQKRFKFFIGEGNNSYLVKSTIRKRFWWNICNSKKQANLVWTQNKSKDFTQKLPCLSPGAAIDAQFEQPQIQYPQNCQQQQIAQLQKQKTCQSPDLQLQPIKLTDRIKVIEKDSNQRCLEKLIRQKVASEDVEVAVKALRKEEYGELEISEGRIHNHVECHWHLSNKKALFANLKRYYESTNQDPFQKIPRTYHIKSPGDSQHLLFLQHFKTSKSSWILKPGENTNRGTGITVSQTLAQIQSLLQSGCSNNCTVILQQYLLPYLYNNRKFDIRCYMLVTSLLGKIKAYWYEEGYVRTSSKEFSMHNLGNRMVHLTNDAVQKMGGDYGRYESCNKLSFREMERYFRESGNGRGFGRVREEMKALAKDCLRATYKMLDPRKREFSFEIFGLDFLIDRESKVWLIQVNTNPCLELSGSLLARIIPHMLQNSLRIALDPLFTSPQPSSWSPSRRGQYSTRVFTGNRYQLLFDQQTDT